MPAAPTLSGPRLIGKLSVSRGLDSATEPPPVYSESHWQPCDSQAGSRLSARGIHAPPAKRRDP